MSERIRKCGEVYFYKDNLNLSKYSVNLNETYEPVRRRASCSFVYDVPHISICNVLPDAIISIQIHRSTG